MFSRATGIPILLAASVGVPYLATNAPAWKNLWPSDSATSTEATAPDLLPPRKVDPQAPAYTRTNAGPSDVVYQSQTPLEGLPSISLEEVFNLNVTREWVYQRWARKSTALAELDYFGVRVPLVTGTQLHDLAGSLSYYFGADGRVQRISFRGTTGDTTPLVTLATQRYGLQRQADVLVGEQLFQTRRGQQVFSELRTRPASVLWEGAPLESFAVEFDLQRPDATTPLPAKTVPLPAVAQAQPEPAAAENSENATAADDQKPKEKWKALFPRSRLPKGQVESLEKRDRYW